MKKKVHGVLVNRCKEEKKENNIKPLAPLEKKGILVENKRGQKLKHKTSSDFDNQTNRETGRINKTTCYRIRGSDIEHQQAQITKIN